MLDFLKGVFSGLVYIQIWEKRLKVVNVNNRMVFDEEPLIALSKNKLSKNKKGEVVVTAVGSSVRAMADHASQNISNPFSHPRLLVGEFHKADKFFAMPLMRIPAYGQVDIKPASVTILSPEMS